MHLLFLGEIRLAAFVAEHNLPFLVMDHLPQLITSVCKDSAIAKKIACGRTKTSAIIRKVAGKQSFEDLTEILKTNKFSLIVDESTDIATKKHVCLVVRYYDTETNNVKDDFFMLIKLVEADASSLYRHICEAFTSKQIPYKENLIGFASDGANVMMGEHHSVKALLLKDVPSLFIMKCICHSFHLCASYASEKLPKIVEDLTRDIYNYFGSSPKRTEHFVEFQTFCNVKIHKILHPSQTRWLSVHMVVSRILEQYEPLKLFFTDAVASNDVLAAENILTRLRDPVTKLFLQFLDFVLPVFNNLNKEMQSESPQIHAIYKRVSEVLKTLFDCFLDRTYLRNTSLENVDFKNPRNFLKIENMYFGASVTRTLPVLGAQISHHEIEFFRLRCLDFYLEGCQQIINRFPLKNNILKEFEFLNPEEVKLGNISSLVNIAALFPNLIKDTDLQSLDTEWRLLRNLKDIKDYENNMETFWLKIKRLKYGDDSPMFPFLGKFITHLLCLPHSSANVERVFSAVNLIKTKQRNKLNTKSINGLLHTKRYIGKQNCYNFKIDQKLYARMSKSMYDTESGEES